MNLRINPEIVLESLASIKGAMVIVSAQVDGLTSDISSGWESENVGIYFTPTIKKVKDSIEEINASVENVKQNVEMYVSNVKTADVKGEFTSNQSGGGTGKGVNTNMAK